MRPVVRTIPILVVGAAAVVAVSDGAFAAGDAAGGPWADLDRAIELAREGSARMRLWIETGYAKRPAVMIGLGIALMLPLLMLVGMLVHHRQPAAAAVDLGGQSGSPNCRAARLEFEGEKAVELPAGRDLVQIGSENDNDICIEDGSIQRYHAIIARSHGQSFTITDVSGRDEDGLRINGQLRSSAVLADGDMVELGNARMKFAIAA